MATWTTKDGKTIRVCDMETNHVANCIGYLKRCIKKLESNEEAGWCLLGLVNGEEAQHSIEHGLDAISRKIPPCLWWIKRFELELQRREVAHGG